jgi:histidine kinase
MNFWRQLRWRIIAAHMAVVLVGVTMLTLTVELIISRVAIDHVTVEWVEMFRTAVMRSLLVAALAAATMGLVASFWLARQILRPLNEIARSSRRIAGGRYDERVAVPASDELAQVAGHFNLMAEALAQVEQQRVTLIGNVAHELRTPLSGLAGYLEGVMDGLLPADPETFAVMYQEVRRLRRLVNELQALSRVEAGQMELELQTFDLQAVVQQAVGQMRPQAEERRLQLEAGFAAGTEPTLLVYADPDRTAQVLLNLLSNAVRYTPEGGRVTVHAGPAPAAPGERAARFAAVSVLDDGIGIPAESLPYLFERFYRVDPSRSRHSGGSGIGLAIARHLVWAMGGELTAHSDGPDQGSTFTFTLPLARPIR